MAKKTPAPNKIQHNLSVSAQDDALYTISQYLANVKFAPRMMGVDEADVWRKLEKLCELYEDALTAERMKSAQLQEDISQLQQKYDSMKDKAKQLLVAYQKLVRGDKADG